MSLYLPNGITGRLVDFSPKYSPDGSLIPFNIGVDGDNNLLVRGPILTDEGGFRLNFANTSLDVTLGTLTFTAGSNIVTTAVDLTTVDLHRGDYIKLDADGESAWRQIETFNSINEIVLTSSYPNTGTGAASRSVMQRTTGTGSSFTVASGSLALVVGTNTNITTSLSRFVDYPPLIYRGRFNMTARTANQDVYIGFWDQSATKKWFAQFRFNGTTNTSVICETGRNPTGAPSVSEIESTTVVLPQGLTSAVFAEYRIEFLTERIVFYINNIRVAEHTRSIPHQHDEMEAGIRVINGGVAPSANTINCDFITCKNHNKVEVGIFSDTEQIVASQPDLSSINFNQAGVIAINTDIVVIDCSRFRSLLIHCTSMGTTGVVTAQWTNEPALTVASRQTATLFTQAGVSQTTITAAGLIGTNVFARYLVLRMTTATTAGTTTFFINGSQLSLPVFFATQVVSATNLSTNINQWGGGTPLSITPNGSTNRALVSALAGPLSNTDYSAQAWAAASGSGATIADTSGLGSVCSFHVNLTAWTAGGSTGLDIFLQWSPDNGTTWLDLWQCEALTAIGNVFIPAIPINGRRRFRWVNRGGAATTATVTITAMSLSNSVGNRRQFFDRTAGLLNGTLNANSASYDITGCKIINARINLGAATTPATYQIQVSDDGVAWSNVGTATPAVQNAVTTISVNNICARFGRVTCTSAGTGQTGNYVSLTGNE